MDGKPSIAIVGGAGFVGSSLAKHLSEKFDVAVFDIKHPQGFDGRFQECDLRDTEALNRLVDSFDLLINTAIVQVPEINEKKRLGYEVNVLGVQKLCEAVDASASLKGMIHASSWHVFGERGLKGTLDEESGYRPDKVDQRAQLYALCKVAQEAIIRINAQMSSKRYGIIRLGTVLGNDMPRQTAANLFIEKALKDEPMTPFKDTQYRPMLYVDVRDVCKAFDAYATAMLSTQQKDLPRTVNLFYPEPVTILELAKLIRRTIIKLTNGQKRPEVKVLDRNVRSEYRPQAKRDIKVDLSKAKGLGFSKLINPQEGIEGIVASRLRASG